MLDKRGILVRFPSEQKVFLFHKLIRPTQWIPRFFTWWQSGQGVKLTTLYLVRKLRMSGTLPPLPQIPMACTGPTLPLPKSDSRMNILLITNNSRTPRRYLIFRNITYSHQHGIINWVRKKRWDNQTAYSPPT